MSDNEHTAASLGHSVELSVKHSVGEPIPELPQAPEEGTKVPSSVAGQDAGHVLPNQPFGPIAVSDCKIREGQVSTGIGQSLAQSRDAEGLARGSADKNIDSCIGPFLELGHVAEVRRFGVVMGKHSAREGFDLAEGERLPAQRMPCTGRGFNTTANAQIAHHFRPFAIRESRIRSFSGFHLRA
jgi:hypothetical protein